MRVLALILLGMLVILAGCGNEIPAVSPTKTPTNTPVAAPTLEPASSPTTTPTATPEPTATSTPTPTEIPATPTIDALRYPVSIQQDLGGVILRVTKVSLTEIDKMPEDTREALLRLPAWRETRTILALAVEVENTTDKTAGIFANQGKVVVGNEQVDVDLMQSSGDLGGDIHAGVLKEGQIVAPLKRSNRNDITKIVYIVSGPHDPKTYERLAEGDYRLEIPLQ